MKRRILSIFVMAVLRTACCFGSGSKTIVVNADNADYDGVKITLQGAVLVDHPIGILGANYVVMQPKAGFDGEIASVELKENVSLRLTEGGHLSCSDAVIDVVNNSAKCCGNSQNDHVVYTENVSGKNGEKLPVVMKCKTLSLQLDEQQAAGEKPLKDKVREIVAHEQVTVNYNHDFIVSGNQAVYHRHPPLVADDSSVPLPGTITLTSSEGSGSCLVTNQCGDMVYANTIEIDTRNRQLVLENPKGTMFRNPTEVMPENALCVRADLATWEEHKGVIVLKGHVEVNDPAMGTLRSNDEIRLFSTGQQCKQWVRAESQGESTLIYKSHGSPYAKTVKCFGLCVLDHEKLEARLTSPRDENGQRIDDKQVFYSDEKGEIFADKVFIEYKNIEKEIKPHHINLSGHVKILNRLPELANPEKLGSQYILADNVEFNPETKIMVLSATKGRRVLIYDEENDIEMSAQGVKIIRDAFTKRDAIEGCGDVRFHLVEQELEKLRQQFSLDKITNKFIRNNESK